ncbi:3D/G5 domain-containing protein [Clostridium disporicum]|uniref:3D/G5 domain-containing protein n=1 Tax=Clostridium disporicum TaxID=84024 RepID=A0A174BFF9_9CLOT|nr:3D/G5 domain-containing protein [Clostridium disporicum]
MFKKLFVSLTVITLSALTSFPTFANALSTTVDINNHKFKYNEFKENVDNVEKLNKILKNPTSNDVVEEVSNTDVTVKNIDSSDTTDENNHSGYISNFIMESTAYTGDGITATGTVPTRNEGGYSTIAVDPSVIPLGSLLYIDGYGYAVAEDTGGAIQGNIIDLYLNSHDDCMNWGRRDVSVYLIAYPGQW